MLLKAIFTDAQNRKFGLINKINVKFDGDFLKIRACIVKITPLFEASAYSCRTKRQHATK
jgi:hypothetical protein